MLFVIHALDYPGALDKRLANREAHLAACDVMREAGHLRLAIALKNADGHMCGSLMVLDYPDEDTLRSQWLASEPYMLGNVWETVTINAGQPGPAFASLFD